MIKNVRIKETLIFAGRFFRQVFHDILYLGVSILIDLVYSISVRYTLLYYHSYRDKQGLTKTDESITNIRVLFKKQKIAKSTRKSMVFSINVKDLIYFLYSPFYRFILQKIWNFYCHSKQQKIVENLW